MTQTSVPFVQEFSREVEEQRKTYESLQRWSVFWVKVTISINCLLQSITAEENADHCKAMRWLSVIPTTIETYPHWVRQDTRHMLESKWKEMHLLN